MHIYLSPHADDIALSCGSFVSGLTQQGESVLILTLTLGKPPNPLPLTPFFKNTLAQWGLGDDFVGGRKQEEVCAAAVLRAEVRFGNFPDAPYRLDANQTVLYRDFEEITHTFHIDDPLQDTAQAAEYVIGQLPPLDHTVTLHAPLGVGGHVDHIVTRNIGYHLATRYPQLKVYFYEEFPYRRGGEETIQQALHTFDKPLMRIQRHVLDVNLNDKINAILCYQSQLSSFWPDQSALVAEISQEPEYEWRLLR